MYLHSTRSGLIDSDARRSEPHWSLTTTSPTLDEPYAEVIVVDHDNGFTAEEEAFFAAGDEMERADDDDFLFE